MKIIKIECPSCGSNLNATDDVSRVACKYCGATVIVEDSKMEGYNQELGKLQAKSDTHIKLANEIDELIKPLTTRFRSTKEQTKLENKSKELTSSIADIDKMGKVKLLGKIAGGIIVLYIILIAAKATTGAFIFFGIASCLAVFIGAFIAVTKREKLIDELEATENLIIQHEAKIKEANLIISQHPNIQIPQKYIHKRALEFIRNSIKSQEAVTVEHAISLYEKLLREEKTIALQKEQIRLQHQQLEEMQDIIDNTQYYQ